jgi:hypothetical protein
MPLSSENVPKLTRKQLSLSRVIARGRRIRDVERLIEQYGGTVKEWAKKSTQPFVWQDHVVEIHWYEHDGLGRFEEKTKFLS